MEGVLVAGFKVILKSVSSFFSVLTISGCLQNSACRAINMEMEQYKRHATVMYDRTWSTVVLNCASS